MRLSPVREAVAEAVVVDSVVAVVVVAMEADVEVAAMEADAEVAAMEAAAMEVDAEVVAAMVVDRAAMTRVAMGAAVATEVDREVMGAVDTEMSPSKAMYSTNAEHQVFSMCFVTTIKQFPYFYYSHLLLYRHLLPTLADLQLISH